MLIDVDVSLDGLDNTVGCCWALVVSVSVEVASVASLAGDEMDMLGLGDVTSR